MQCRGKCVARHCPIFARPERWAPRPGQTLLLLLLLFFRWCPVNITNNILYYSTSWHTSCTSLPLLALASLCWHWWVSEFCCVLFLARTLFWCLSPHWGTKVFATHVTSWRWESRRRGISELHDWWLLYCRSLVFSFAPSHTERHHNNNAVMSAFSRNGQMAGSLFFLRCSITKNAQCVVERL